MTTDGKIKTLSRNISIKKTGNLPISRELKRVDKSDVLVSSDYNILNPSATTHKDSKWPKIETAMAIRKEDSARLCELLNTCERKKFNKSFFFDVKYHNHENIIFQDMSAEEQIFNVIKHRCEEVNRFRNGFIRQHLTSVDIEEIVRVGVVIIGFLKFFCDKIDYNRF